MKLRWQPCEEKREGHAKQKQQPGRKEGSEGRSEWYKVRLVGRSDTIMRGRRGHQKELGFYLKLRKSHRRILSRDDQV